MDDLGNRMKQNYESRSKSYLTRRIPVIMRLDGKAFHTFTKGFEKPFSKVLSGMMINTAIKLCEDIQGAKCAYVQNDEISILITDFDKLTTDAWFDYNTQKMTSISSSIATAEFNAQFIFNKVVEQTMSKKPLADFKLAYFDSRVFNLPDNEVCNYFIWRQKDWFKNSTDLEDKWKNGTFICKQYKDIKENVIRGYWDILPKCPIFHKDRLIIEQFLVEEEE